MSRRWFGTDGIRGPAWEGPLAPGFLRALGQALAQGAPGGGEALIAQDTRESSAAMARLLACGLAQGGLRPVRLGVLPTGGLPPQIRAAGAALGLVVSASHNPWADNGVKVFGADGAKLADAEEAAVEARLSALAPQAAAPLPAESDTPGERRDGAQAYLDWLLGRFAGVSLRGWKLAVDCAHGSASAVAPAALRRLGAQVTALHDAPDGRNINEGCGSTHVEALAAVVAEAAAAGRPFDAGLSFDGDADRVLLVDAAGRVCDGDHLLGLLGPLMAERDELPGRALVATVMSNLGLERHLARHGLSLRRCAVGDRYVLAALREQGLALGGEASGHVLIREGEHYVGDGPTTALAALSGLSASGRPVAALIDEAPRVPQRLVNVKVAAKPPLEALPRLTAAARQAQERHGAELRILLRYSGTENLARVMVEGVDAALVEALTEQLAALWADEVAAGGRP